jgi:hypothetical protein
MNATLAKVLVAMVPSCMLFVASAVMFVKERRLWSVLQLLGAAGIVIVVLTHLCEALQLFPWMRWGQEHSVGHYVDLWSAIVGVTLFPVGCLLHAWTMRRA